MDDDPLICQSLELILRDYSQGEIEVIATCTSGEECMQAVSAHEFDVILLDIHLPQMSGIDVTRLLTAHDPHPSIVMLTSLTPRDVAQQCVEAGAQGFISKTDSPEDIIRAVRGAARGIPQFNQNAQHQLLNDIASQQFRSRRDEARQLLRSLPDREYQAVILAARGLTNSEIAAEMYISERTAKAHLSSACTHLGLASMNRVLLGRIVERAAIEE